MKISLKLVIFILFTGLAFLPLYSTVNGFIYEGFGTLPKAMDSITISNIILTSGIWVYILLSLKSELTITREEKEKESKEDEITPVKKRKNQLSKKESKRLKELMKKAGIT